MIDSLLEAISMSPVATYMAEDPFAFPWVETFHVISLVLVFGSILLVDLRLMGLASRDYTISGLSRTILPVTWVAFLGAVITGSLLFASNPYGYFDNTAFRAKVILLLLAGVNMAMGRSIGCCVAKHWHISECRRALPGYWRSASGPIPGHDEFDMPLIAPTPSRAISAAMKWQRDPGSSPG